jgi:spore germination protein GerM
MKWVGLLLWGCVCGSGCHRPAAPPAKPPETAPPAKPEKPEPLPSGQQVSVTLYFPDANYEYLVPERRRVPADKATPRGRLELLLQGPQGKGHEAVLPSDLPIEDVSVAGGTATVSLPERFESDVGGENTALLAVQSIVYTLTERDDVKNVQFLIGGQKPASFAGALDLSGPQRRDETLKRKT